uniref:BZIP domain-containing protein n=1 Tax=Angiostrongylus cantonensis TaxID=6313 RepID=A0A0K0DI00_ANGCA
MLCDFFRSESEHCAKSGDSADRCVSKHADQDSVIFYSVQYEEDLLMKYIGESAAPGESVGESEAEFSNFDPFIFDELPSYCYIDPTRPPVSFPDPDSSSFPDNVHADCVLKVSNVDGNTHRPVPYQEQPYVSSVQKLSRRGRPMKVTSTSKMAKYARSYREQKKNQLLACEARIKDLTEENEFLRSENKRLSEGFARLTEQVNRLRKMIDRNTYTYRDPLQTPYFSYPSYEKDPTDDDMSSFIKSPQ